MHVIYVDVYFAINFLMDFIILVVAKQILNFKGKIEVRTAIRCVIAALFGATYSVIILVLKVKYGVLQILFTWLVVPYIMTGIAFNNRKLSGIKMLTVVYCVTFVLNGVVSMLSSYSFGGNSGTGKNTGTQKIKCTNADVWNSNWMSANEGGSLSNAKQTQDPQKSV